MPDRCPIAFRPLAAASLALLACATPGQLSAQAVSDAPGSQPAQASQPVDASAFEGRPVSAVRFEGVSGVNGELIENSVRTRTGLPLSWNTVRDDLQRFERLGRFSRLRAELEPQADGSVAVIFIVQEAQVIADIAVVGNRAVGDDEISAVIGQNVSLVRGVPVDKGRVEQAARAVEELYRARGFYQAQVSVEQEELDSSGIIVFRVREGERIRVTGIRFSGNEAYSRRQVQSNINLRRAGVFEKGALDDEILERDVAAIQRFYRDRGYLDARVSRELTLSPDGSEVIVTFLIDESALFTIREVLFRRMGADANEPDGGLSVMTPEQARAVLPIKRGAVASALELRNATNEIRNAYGLMGYADIQVGYDVLRRSGETQVDIVVNIRERDEETTTGRFRTGLILVQGNTTTQAKVIRRVVDMDPDRWFNAAQVREAQDNLRNSRLFDPSGTRITVQDENPANPGYRDVLIEVQETNTGTLSLGASVDSDAGLVGAFTLNQRNFDIFDTPDSLSEFVRGRAFRGGAQTFNLSLSPGTDVSTYAIGLTEPAVLESDVSMSVNAFFRERNFDDYDEARFGGDVTIGRAFGTRWVGSVSVSAQDIEITEIEPGSPRDYFDVEGNSFLSTVNFRLVRNTTDNRFRPTKGTRTEFKYTQAGLLGGDYSFSRFEIEHAAFFRLLEDELGRSTTLRVGTRVGYVPNEEELPVFERFYLGGRTFRGFDFRGVGPLGLTPGGALTDEHVGGSWMLHTSAQLQHPLVGRFVDGVIFTEAGTLSNDPGFEDLRVSAGMGVRLFLPQFGPTPLAFDFAWPLMSEEGDEEQLFSFALELPF